LATSRACGLAGQIALERWDGFCSFSGGGFRVSSGGDGCLS